MQERIIDLFKNSEDANLGQTLIRLAKLSEAAHDFEAFQSQAKDTHSIKFTQPTSPTESFTKSMEAGQ